MESNESTIDQNSDFHKDLKNTIKISTHGGSTGVKVNNQKISRSNKSAFLTMKDWTDEELKIKEPIIDALLDEGFQHPSIIQSVAIPLIIRSEDKFYGYKNLVAQSPNGSGKSLAFIVGCLQ